MGSTIEALDVRVLIEDNEGERYITITCVLGNATLPVVDCAHVP